MSTSEGRLKRTLLLGIFILLLVFAGSLYKGFRELQLKNHRFFQAQTEVARLEQKNGELKSALAQDPAFEAETEIRDQLGLAKPGETVIMLDDQAILGASSSPINLEAPEQGQKKWWQKLLD